MFTFSSSSVFTLLARHINDESDIVKCDAGNIKLIVIDERSLQPLLKIWK